MNPTLFNNELRNRLREFSGQEVFYYNTPGNAGDSLIQSSAYQMLRDLKIKFRLLDPEQETKGETVLLGGGGNLVPAYKGIRKNLERIHQKAAKVIILPQTIRGNEELLAQLGSNVEIYCRDVPSYQHVLQYRSSASVFLAHDLAFSIDIPRLLAAAGNDAARLITEKIPTSPHILLASQQVARFFLRKDSEKTARLSPASSLDLSSIFKTGTSPKKAEIGAAALVTYLKTVEEVHTDRLHVGIAGSILGKRVFLYDNSYGKNACVYEHSLHQNFPKTQLIR